MTKFKQEPNEQLVSVRLPKDIHLRLKKQAARFGIGTGAICRVAIVQFLEREEKIKKALDNKGGE